MVQGLEAEAVEAPLAPTGACEVLVFVFVKWHDWSLPGVGGWGHWSTGGPRVLPGAGPGPAKGFTARARMWGLRRVGVLGWVICSYGLRQVRWFLCEARPPLQILTLEAD